MKEIEFSMAGQPLRQEHEAAGHNMRQTGSRETNAGNQLAFSCPSDSWAGATPLQSGSSLLS